MVWIYTPLDILWRYCLQWYPKIALQWDCTIARRMSTGIHPWPPTAAAKQLYMCYAEDFVSNDISQATICVLRWRLCKHLCCSHLKSTTTTSTCLKPPPKEEVAPRDSRMERASQSSQKDQQHTPWRLVVNRAAEQDLQMWGGRCC